MISARFRQVYKTLAFLAMSLVFIVHTLIAHLWLTDDKKRRGFYVRNTGRYTSILLRLLGIRVRLAGTEPSVDGDRSLLVVSNHLSYIDSLTFMAAVPSSFVTTMEVKNMPFIGLLMTLSGCIFVERRSKDKNNKEKEIEQLAGVMKQGANVTFYAEATSTSGESVLPFKMTMFEAALRAEKSVQPVCLSLRKVNDSPVTVENRDLYCYYKEDDEIFPHLLKLFAQKSFDIELEFLEQIHPHIGETRKDLAKLAHEKVAIAYENKKLPPAPAGVVQAYQARERNEAGEQRSDSRAFTRSWF